MCCECCDRYEICEENDKLKDECCDKCPHYYDCVGRYGKEEAFDNDDFTDN